MAVMGLNKRTPIGVPWLVDAGFKKETTDEGDYYFVLEFNDEKYCDLSLMSDDKNGFLEVVLFPYEEWFRYRYVVDVERLYFGLTGTQIKGGTS